MREISALEIMDVDGGISALTALEFGAIHVAFGPAASAIFLLGYVDNLK